MTDTPSPTVVVDDLAETIVTALETRDVIFLDVRLGLDDAFLQEVYAALHQQPKVTVQVMPRPVRYQI
jgi:hypothetical protein